MIYITGDTHADFSRFEIKRFPEQSKLTRDDYMIICGDFGGVWDDSPKRINNLDWLAESTFTILFVDGNHENFDMLGKYPVEEWNGGQVQFIRENIIHLMRGQVFTIEGKKIFTMGGASSHDIDDGILEPDDPEFDKKCKELIFWNAMFRINHISWWKEELPNYKEYEAAEYNLAEHNWKVDYIFSHCGPTSIINMTNRFYGSDHLTEFFDKIKDRCEFKYWFFGHHHIFKYMVVDGKKYIMLYKQIVELDAQNDSSPCVITHSEKDWREDDLRNNEP